MMIDKLKILIIFLPLFLYGCTGDNGNGETPTNVPNPTVKAEDVVLRWWGVFDTKEDVQPLIDKYEDLHPNVKIQYIQQAIPDGDMSKYVELIDKFIVDAEQSPDIFMIHNTWAGKYESKISKAPVNVIPESYFDDFYSIVKNDFYKNGTIALPQYMDAIAIIYNVDLLLEKTYTAPSKDWAKFKDMAIDLTQKQSSNITISGFSAGFYDNVQFRFDTLNQILMVNGITMTDRNNTSAVFYDQGQRNDTDQAIEFYNELGKATWNKNMKKDIGAFLDGKLAMYAAPSWRLIDILNYKEEYNIPFSVGVSEMPQLTNTSKYWPTYWGYTVSSQSSSSEVVESWKFLKFLTEEEQLEEFNKTVQENGRPIGILFPRKDMNSANENNRLLSPYVLAISKASNWYMNDGYSMQNEFNTYLSDPQNLRDLSGLQSTATSIMLK